MATTVTKLNSNTGVIPKDTSNNDRKEKSPTRTEVALWAGGLGDVRDWSILVITEESSFTRFTIYRSLFILDNRFSVILIEAGDRELHLHVMNLHRDLFFK